MGRESRPLRAPGGQPQAAVAPLIPGTPEGKVSAGGPLGPRGLSPQLLQQLVAARDQTQVPSGGGIQMGAPPPPTPEIPEQPSALDFGDPDVPRAEEPAAKKVEEKKPESGVDPNAFMNSVAMTGMEFRANPVLARDDEFISDIWWMSSPERRKEIDARCEPINWSGFMTGMDITQRVHMWLTPFDLWVTFRKVKADDEFLARRIITDSYSRNDAEGEIGLLVTTAAASVVSINDQKLPAIPSPLEKDMDTRMAVMLERVKFIGTRDMSLVRDLVINYAWFVRRAQLATRGVGKGSLGNG
jgi:hypothetical protein